MRCFLPLLLCGLLYSPAFAEVIVSQEKPAASPDHGPVEAVVQGTDFPASAITPLDGEGQWLGGGKLTSTPAPDPTLPKDTPKAKAGDPLWPRDTVPVFVTACAGLHQELSAPCRCVIERLMPRMGHDEFIRLTQEERIEADPRYQQARSECVATPRKRAE